MFHVENIYYIATVILCQSVLIWPYPRRSFFALRLLGSLAACILLAFLFPMPDSLKYTQWYQMLRFLFMLALTIIAAIFCFNCKISSVIAVCIGGQAIQHISFQLAELLRLIPAISDSAWVQPVTLVATCVAAFFTLGMFIAKNSLYKNCSRGILALCCVILFICIGLSRLWRINYPYDPVTTACIAIYAITCCVLTLILKFVVYRFVIVKSEKMTLERINEEESKQYMISKENMELLNIKCHDIKHFLQGAQNDGAGLSEMQNLVDAYDNTVRTGLSVLDIILNEKSNQCRKSGIKLTFWGDGSCLSFMDIMDIYSLFGNMLTNAIEAAEKLSADDKKVISLTVERRGNIIYISEMNYCEGRIKFQGDLPVTRKDSEAGYHGFGMKSMRMIARKYSGDISAVVKDNLFSLSVYVVSGEEAGGAQT